MPLTGSSSFDLYVGGPGAWRAVGAAAFMPHKTEFKALLFDRQEEGEREYMLHFPLYNGVHELWIGLEESAWIKPPTSWSSDSPVVVYGTSITQGGCASRPGMAWTNILSRWRNRDFINLGFSGNGKGETEMAEYLANISNAGAFILDYEANAHLNGLKKTLKNFLAILRSTHPKTPIFIISALPIKFQIAFGANDNTAEKYPERAESRAWQEQFVNEQRFAGDKNLYFIDGNELLGNDWDECMPDGCHLNDLGFYRLAEALNRLLHC
jgi:lysophospholipase L1-like esterase